MDIYIGTRSNSITQQIMLSYSLVMTVNSISGLFCIPIDGHGCLRAESSRVLMKRSGDDLEMSATFTSSSNTASAQPASSTLVAAPSFVMIPTATGQFVQPFVVPAAQVGSPFMINGQLTAAPQQFMMNGAQVANGANGAPRRRIRIIRPNGGGRRARFRGGGGGGGGGGGRRFRRLRGGRGGRGGGSGRASPIVIVDNGGQQGQQMSQPLMQPMVQPIIQPVIQPFMPQQPFLGNPLVQSNPPPIQVQSVTAVPVTSQPQTAAPTLYQTTVPSVQDNKSSNKNQVSYGTGGSTVFVPAAPVVNLMMVPTTGAEKPGRGSLRDRRRNRVRTRVKLRLKEWVNKEERK